MISQFRSKILRLSIILFHISRPPFSAPPSPAALPAHQQNTGRFADPAAVLALLTPIWRISSRRGTCFGDCNRIKRRARELPPKNLPRDTQPKSRYHFGLMQSDKGRQSTQSRGPIWQKRSNLSRKRCVFAPLSATAMPMPR